MVSPPSWNERILRVIEHIQSHLDETLTPEELAKLAGFSLHHFHRVFRGLTGESVMGLVRRLRVERAARRLRHGDQSVTRVALDAGYDSHEGFTRAFRDAFGRAPTAFRQQFREQPLPESFAELEAREARHCITRRFIGPYEACGQAWGELTSWAASAGLI